MLSNNKTRKREKEKAEQKIWEKEKIWKVIRVGKGFVSFASLPSPLQSCFSFFYFLNFLPYLWLRASSPLQFSPSTQRPWALFWAASVHLHLLSIQPLLHACLALDFLYMNLEWIWFLESQVWIITLFLLVAVQWASQVQ